jgi:hypothetical protein
MVVVVVVAVVVVAVVMVDVVVLVVMVAGNGNNQLLRGEESRHERSMEERKEGCQGRKDVKERGEEVYQGRKAGWMEEWEGGKKGWKDGWKRSTQFSRRE